MKRRCILLFLVALSALWSLTSCEMARSSEEILLDDETDLAGEGADLETEEDIAQEELIVVYVCGAVVRPGVYELEPQARIDDAIQSAGGCAEGADPTYLNLAARIADGERIYVPTIEEVRTMTAEEASVPGQPAGREEDGRVNINRATKEELMTLPGIGESKAEAIIAYREENGPFAAIEDIMQIAGIKDGVFQKIKDRIVV